MVAGEMFLKNLETPLTIKHPPSAVLSPWDVR